MRCQFVLAMVAICIGALYCLDSDPNINVRKKVPEKITREIAKAKSENNDVPRPQDSKAKSSPPQPTKNIILKEKNIDPKKQESDIKEQEQEKLSHEKTKIPKIEKHRVFVGVSYQVMPEGFGEEKRLLKNLDSGKNYQVKNEIDLPLGKYLLELEREGYKPYRKQFEISPGSPEMYFFQCNFEPISRKFKVTLKSDYPPGEILQPDKILLNGRLLEENESVKPGNYELKIAKDGYTSVEEFISVSASSQDYCIAKNLCVLERIIMLEIFERESRKALSVDRILIGGTPVDKRLSLKPGNYDLQIFAKGYRPLQKQLELPVGSSLFRIALFLDKLATSSSKGRTLVFKMSSPKGELVEPLSIFVNGEPFSSQIYPLNTRLKFEVRFKDYQTYFGEFVLKSGDKPVVIQAQLTYLPSLIFFVSEYEFALDNLPDRWNFYVDGKPIEPHLAEIVESGNEAQVTLRVSPNTEKIQIYKGYFYAEYDLATLPTVVENFDRISLVRWQRHFDKLKRLKGPSLAFQYMERFFEQADNVKKLQNSAKHEDLQKLSAYLKDWPVPEDWQKKIEGILYKNK